MLGVVLLGWPAHAQSRDGGAASDAPWAADAPTVTDVPPAPVAPPATGAPGPTAAPTRRNFLIPAVETELFHLALASFNNLALRESFAQISPDSVLSHFDGRRPWTFDVDSFETNQVGHPVQGMLSFTAARSSGLGFWWASLYAFTSSLTWELVYEIDAPSINDQFTTTMGGTLLGEVLHRSAALIAGRRSRDSSVVRQVLAAIVEPIGAFNRWYVGHQLDEEDLDSAPHFAYLGVGTNFAGFIRDSASATDLLRQGPQVNLQAQVSYGILGDPNFHYTAPLSHFDLNANVSFPGTPIVSLFIRGLLFGSEYQNASGTLRGLWGLFGQYDFAQPAIVRASAVGVGPGTSLQWRFAPKGFLQLSAVVSASPFGSAGNLGIVDPNFRDYHIGPGGQGVVEARLIHSDLGMLRLVAREWVVTGLYTEQTGFESVTYVTLGLLARLFWRIGLGVDAVFAYRLPFFKDPTRNHDIEAGTVRVTLDYLTEAHFGAIRPVR